MEAPSLGDTSTENLETWSCGANIQASSPSGSEWVARCDGMHEMAETGNA